MRSTGVGVTLHNTFLKKNTDCELREENFTQLA